MFMKLKQIFISIWRSVSCCWARLSNSSSSSPTSLFPKFVITTPYTTFIFLGTTSRSNSIKLLLEIRFWKTHFIISLSYRAFKRMRKVEEKQSYCSKYMEPSRNREGQYHLIVVVFFCLLLFMYVKMSLWVYFVGFILIFYASIMNLDMERKRVIWRRRMNKRKKNDMGL